jgi:hypothetical protein
MSRFSSSLYNLLSSLSACIHPPHFTPHFLFSPPSAQFLFTLPSSHYPFLGTLPASSFPPHPPLITPPSSPFLTSFTPHPQLSLASAMKELDKDGSGTIDLHEFSLWCVPCPCARTRSCSTVCVQLFLFHLTVSNRNRYLVSQNRFEKLFPPSHYYFYLKNHTYFRPKKLSNRSPVGG